MPQLSPDISHQAHTPGAPRRHLERWLKPVAKGIPPTPAERDLLLRMARHYVAEYNPVPPLPLASLKERAGEVLRLARLSQDFRDYVAVLVNNEMWREPLAHVPYSRRLLLLPKCLRDEGNCPASFDAVGLLCQQCGLCSIQDLQAEAERLGYAVLVAEGSAAVMSLIQTGRIEAIVGVSCMGVLDKAFPYMEAAAIPGVAVPLLHNDCADSGVDLEWVWDYIHLTSADQTRRLDLTSLREQVESWFSQEALASIMGPAEGQTERLGREWLVRAGKRWRPFLTVAAFQALRENPGAPLPEAIRKLAVAIECFHKASLLHDDIEDEDAERYGQKTFHTEHGVPVALNTGDLLIGEGYRLIGECDVAAREKVEMLRVAAEGQRRLCRGQGAELWWLRQPAPLSPSQVLDIFRDKTAPAFAVALDLGALFARGNGFQNSANDEDPHRVIAGVLRRYSEALGIGYQIRDDLKDCWPESGESGDSVVRPGLLLALASKSAPEADRDFLDRVWRERRASRSDRERLQRIYLSLGVDTGACGLLEAYQEQAIQALSELDNANLKGLLRRVIGRILHEPEIRGWCKECGEASGRGGSGA